jgi:hypothetical protein
MGSLIRSPRAANASAIDRCDREIAECEALLRDGHPDVQGLCRALADWSIERRLINGLARTCAQTNQHQSAGGQSVQASPAGE